MGLLNYVLGFLSGLVFVLLLRLIDIFFEKMIDLMLFTPIWNKIKGFVRRMFSKLKGIHIEARQKFALTSIPDKNTLFNELKNALEKETKERVIIPVEMDGLNIYYHGVNYFVTFIFDSSLEEELPENILEVIITGETKEFRSGIKSMEILLNVISDRLKALDPSTRKTSMTVTILSVSIKPRFEEFLENNSILKSFEIKISTKESVRLELFPSKVIAYGVKAGFPPLLIDLCESIIRAYYYPTKKDVKNKQIKKI